MVNSSLHMRQAILAIFFDLSILTSQLFSWLQKGQLNMVSSGAVGFFETGARLLLRFAISANIKLRPDSERCAGRLDIWMVLMIVLDKIYCIHLVSKSFLRHEFYDFCATVCIRWLIFVLECVFAVLVTRDRQFFLLWKRAVNLEQKWHKDNT